MKKKNIIALLLIPFLIASLSIVTIKTTYHAVEIDIQSIDWDYGDYEPFKLSNSMYKLSAKGIMPNAYAASDGNELVWSVKNKDGEEEPYAEIVYQNGKYYLKTNKEGEVVVTCSNAKGTVFRSMTGIIYDKGAIILQPSIKGSQNNIDSKIYYGEYDLVNGQKQAASVQMEVKTIPSTLKNSLRVKEEQNVSFDIDNQVATITGLGDASFTLTCDAEDIQDVSYSFSVVDEGVNVYTYSDLIACTNKSAGGEIVVLRKSFESKENAYKHNSDGKVLFSGGTPVLKENNVECYGNYNFTTEKFQFSETNGDVYSFETTFNQNYIQQWNQFASANAGYSPVSNRVYAGLRIQKDFYGNGYTLNLHNLTYPYEYIDMSDGNGGTVRVVHLTKDNLFRGPKTFYTLGDPNNLPLVSALGQDNVSMYVDGNGITVNDVNVKNCDFGNRYANMDTVGNVMEIHGDNVTVKNSKLSNGRNVLRSFSSMNLTVKNCMLSFARNFLFVAGANEYVSVEPDTIKSLPNADLSVGDMKNVKLEDYFQKEADGDNILCNFLTNVFQGEDRTKMQERLDGIQKALSAIEEVEGQYKGSTVIEDVFFYRSGIASICMESLFNGPFLYSASPSLLTDMFALIKDGEKAIIPYTPTYVSGTSYPVKVDVKGKTRFYDYKTSETLELDGLIDENISAIVNSLELYDGEITIDDIFPLKPMFMKGVRSLGGVFKADDKENVSVPVAYYGGGMNLSVVSFDEIENANNYTAEFDVDITGEYLKMVGGASQLAQMKNIMLRTVTTVTGFEPFTFRAVKNGYLYGETPKVFDLIENAKGE